MRKMILHFKPREMKKLKSILKAVHERVITEEFTILTELPNDCVISKRRVNAGYICSEIMLDLLGFVLIQLDGRNNGGFYGKFMYFNPTKLSDVWAEWIMRTKTFSHIEAYGKFVKRDYGFDGYYILNSYKIIV